MTTPYPGTDLYKEALVRGIISNDVWKEFAEQPKADFKPPLWTENFKREELIELLNFCYKKFYISWDFLLKEMFSIRSFRELGNKFKAGLKLMKR